MEQYTGKKCCFMAEQYNGDLESLKNFIIECVGKRDVDIYTKSGNSVMFCIYGKGSYNLSLGDYLAYIPLAGFTTFTGNMFKALFDPVGEEIQHDCDTMFMVQVERKDSIMDIYGMENTYGMKKRYYVDTKNQEYILIRSYEDDNIVAIYPCQEVVSIQCIDPTIK